MSSRTRQLREENREAARFLSQTSNAALDDITDRLRAVSINAYQIETVRQDVIRMLTDAEARGDTPEDVLGDDYDAFCSNVLAALPQPPLSYQFLNTLRTMLRVAVRCSVVSLLLHMPENMAGVRQNWGGRLTCRKASAAFQSPSTSRSRLAFCLAGCFFWPLSSL